jgi:hypothetical protein
MMDDGTPLVLQMAAEYRRQAGLSDLEILTEFLIHNPELEQLEERLRQFNLFEVIGMQYQEIRHSFLLAFLLDPQQAQRRFKLNLVVVT